MEQRPTAVYRRRGALTVMEWPTFDGHALDAVVTTRAGGFSSGRYASLNLGLHVGDDPGPVVANRRIVAEALGAELDDLVFCEQTHQPNVAVVSSSDRGRGARTHNTALAATDALVTTTAGVVLVVMVADCVPLVLYDPVHRVLAAVHAGWAGTVRGVTGATVRAMCGLGSHPENILAALGPAVSPERYQVGRDVRDHAREAFGDRVDMVSRPDGTGGWTFDLWAANRIQLLAAGVPDSGIQVAALGTGPGTPFYSHRFEGPCGRFAALARLRSVQP